MSDLFDEFIAESRQQIEAAERALLILARAPNSEAVQACFRALHTLKGNSGFFPLPRIQQLAHVSEQVLDALRDDRIPCDSARIDALLASLSLLAQLIDSVGDGAPEPVGDDSAQLADLLALSLAPSKGLTAPSAASVEGCLRALLAVPPGNIALLVKAMNALLACAKAGEWTGEAAILVQRIDDLCNELVLGFQSDLPVAFARLFGWVEDLRHVLAAKGNVTGANTDGKALDSHLSDEFVGEARELLASAERAVLSGGEILEAEAAHQCFLSFHSIKGQAAYLGLPRIHGLTHLIEGLLTPLRDGTVTSAKAGQVQDLLLAIDALRGLIDQIEEAHADRGPWTSEAQAVAARLGVMLPILDPAHEAPVEPRKSVVAKATASPVATRTPSSTDSMPMKFSDGSARVSITRLDDLMNLVGELIIAHSIVAQASGSAGTHGIAQAITSQGRIIRELQGIALSLRMVPLRGTFQKMSRVVHDISQKLGKEIDLHLTGEETELDRTLAELITDPLMHMMRNAIDHGIENPEERIKAGKPPNGSIRLTARQTTDLVEISLSDDGRGLDPVRLRAKAVEKGLIPAERELTENEAYNLIFLPGFSTATEITDVSGRGVGMDVVQRNLDQASGRMEIQSQLGSGTTFIIRVPLTTAIIDALLVRVGQERFLVPLGSVIEILNPGEGKIQRVANAGRVVESRQRLLPVISLAEVYSVNREGCPPCRLLLVVDSLQRPVAIELDEVIGQQQVVVKPLGRQLGHARGLAGSAILSDGCVGLILDPLQMSAAGAAT